MDKDRDTLGAPPDRMEPFVEKETLTINELEQALGEKGGQLS
jgi:hypothetical protein